jgi:hypothetical protein
MVKLNVWRMVSDHFSTLYDYRTGKRNPWEWGAFILIPLMAGISTVSAGVEFKQTALSGMLTAYSIFAGLLLNLLILAAGLVNNDRLAATDASTVTRKTLLKELYFNLSFGILVSIVNVILAMSALVFVGDVTKNGKAIGTGPIFTFLIASMSSLFLVGLLMILKRIHAVLGNEFARPGLRKVS